MARARGRLILLIFHLGARFRVGATFWEASLGTGVADDSSDLVFTIGTTVVY